MSVIDTIIEHLQHKEDDETLPWTDVKELGALSRLSKQSSGVRNTTLFVFSQGESPSPDVRGSGPYLQSITATFGVVIVAKLYNNDTCDLEPIRQALRKKLFGWTPSTEHEAFWLGQGKLLSIETNLISWLDNFVTEYTEDQNRYGS